MAFFLLRTMKVACTKIMIILDILAILAIQGEHRDLFPSDSSRDK